MHKVLFQSQNDSRFLNELAQTLLLVSYLPLDCLQLCELNFMHKYKYILNYVSVIKLANWRAVALMVCVDGDKIYC